MNLKDKTILVTGGSLGIGRGTAELLIKKGAKVAITGRNKERLLAAATEMGAFPIHADVAKEEDCLRTFKEFLAHFGHLDILINNAGIGGDFGHLEDVTVADFEKVFSVNVFGAAVMGREAANIFKKQNHGDIVNIASTAALKGFARGTVYAASKFALRGMTQCWQAELRKHNVRVILINPSEVQTHFFGGAPTEFAPNKLVSDDIAHAIAGALEMENRGFIPELTVWATNPY